MSEKDLSRSPSRFPIRLALHGPSAIMSQFTHRIILASVSLVLVMNDQILRDPRPEFPLFPLLSLFFPRFPCHCHVRSFQPGRNALSIGQSDIPVSACLWMGRFPMRKVGQTECAVAVPRNHWFPGYFPLCALPREWAVPHGMERSCKALRNDTAAVVRRNDISKSLDPSPACQWRPKNAACWKSLGLMIKSVEHMTTDNDSKGMWCWGILPRFPSASTNLFSIFALFQCLTWLCENWLASAVVQGNSRESSDTRRHLHCEATPWRRRKTAGKTVHICVGTRRELIEVGRYRELRPTLFNGRIFNGRNDMNDRNDQKKSRPFSSDAWVWQTWLFATGFWKQQCDMI
jgi:hypothetical protein